MLCWICVAFELVKVRRQLEYSIAAAKGIQLVKPPGTRSAVRDIVRGAGGENIAGGGNKNNSPKGITALWTGLRLHFGRYSPHTILLSSLTKLPIILEHLIRHSTRHRRHSTLFLRIRLHAAPPRPSPKRRTRSHAVLGPLTLGRHPVCVRESRGGQ